MTVLDASAVVELLLGTERGRAVAARIADPQLGLDAPHLLEVEVAQALRRLVSSGDVDEETAAVALDDLVSLDIERHSHEWLLGRVWMLRDSLTAYDAVYVALAEALDTTVLTCDARLRRAPGIGARVEVIS